MLHAIKNFYKNYFNYTSKTTRSDYWWTILYIFNITFLLTYIFIIATMPVFFENLFNTSADLIKEPVVWSSNVTSLAIQWIGFLSLFLLILFLTCWLPSIALTVRRLRDIDFNTLSIVLFFIGTILISVIFNDSNLPVICALIIQIWLFTRPSHYFVGKHNTFFIEH